MKESKLFNQRMESTVTEVFVLLHIARFIAKELISHVEKRLKLLRVYKVHLLPIHINVEKKLTLAR